jgi:hypothetical protein
MVLKPVPLTIIIGTGITGGVGAVAGAVGGAQINHARTQIRHHGTRYVRRHADHLARVDRANGTLQSLGRTQERARRDVIFRMRDFLEDHAKQVRVHEHLLILDGVDRSRTQVVGMAKLDPGVAGWVQGVVGSAVVGFATPVAIRAAVTELARASTGTRISTLSGAAADRAAHAFLGGGPLAKGGGGVALGKKILGAAPSGPSLLIAGLVVKNRGAKARTEADKFRAEIDVAAAQLDARDQFLRGMRKRASEVDDVLIRLVSQARAALDLLESEPFDIARHAEWLQAALILVKSVRDVATAPIADESGNLDENTAQLVFKYRDASKEAPHA